METIVNQQLLPIKTFYETLESHRKFLKSEGQQIIQQILKPIFEQNRGLEFISWIQKSYTEYIPSCGCDADHIYQFNPNYESLYTCINKSKHLNAREIRRQVIKILSNIQAEDFEYIYGPDVEIKIYYDRTEIEEYHDY